MLHVRRLAPLVLICLLAGALLYVGSTTLRQSDQATCSVCDRPVHLASRVDGDADGESLTFCCAACALRTEKQEARKIRLTRVFSYQSGEALAPEDAVAVVGSDINLCMRNHVLTDNQREPTELHFDRCSPSVLAFASKAEAERFRAEHGGIVQPFAGLEASFQ